HRLAPVLRLQQLLGTATGDLAERDLIAAPMPRPKLLGAEPTVMQTNIRVACCPRVAQRLATDAPEDLVTLRGQVIQRTAQGGLPGGVALRAGTAAAPACHTMRTAPRTGRTQRDLPLRLMVEQIAPQRRHSEIERLRAHADQMRQEAVAPGL